MLSAVRCGSFVTGRRVHAYSLLLLAGYLAALAALLATSDGRLDYAGRPLGTDFINVYAAGKLANGGQAGLAYDWPAHHAVQKQTAGRADLPYAGWHYPPVFLLVAAALALLPYLVALLVYQAVTLVLYLGVVQRIAGRREAWLPALAFPAVFINITHGHNGFITAALLGGALLVLDRRPLLAGCLIGGLSYKPQLAVLIPLVLAATGRWRVFGAAAATVAATAVLALAVFGAGVFADFWASLPLTRRVILEGAPGFYKIQSLYAALRLAGVPLALASAAQTVLTIGLAIALVALWRSAASYELKAAALLIACLLATPYVLDYDLVLLAPAMAFTAAHGLRRGFAPYELTALAALWLLPLAARPLAELTSVSLAPFVMLGALWLIVQRAGMLHGAGTARGLRWR
ncbi:MAG: DUF2029 domain-containing protein [Hyphomicrobiaceae bacterium]|nr:MAG: DUF2029 domain-containing protein [Hyphomicrobiaceae bacterium]